MKVSEAIKQLQAMPRNAELMAKELAVQFRSKDLSLSTERGLMLSTTLRRKVATNGLR